MPNPYGYVSGLLTSCVWKSVLRDVIVLYRTMASHVTRQVSSSKQEDRSDPWWFVRSLRFSKKGVAHSNSRCTRAAILLPSGWLGCVSRFPIRCLGSSNKKRSEGGLGFWLVVLFGLFFVPRADLRRSFGVLKNQYWNPVAFTGRQTRKLPQHLLATGKQCREGTTIHLRSFDPFLGTH